MAGTGPRRRAARRRWKITHILNTHHHGDHVGGNREIKEATGCTHRRPAARRPRPHPRHRRRVGRRRSYRGASAGRSRRVLRARPPAATSPNALFASRRRCSAAIRCLRWAAAGCSRERPPRCGRRSAVCATCPTETAVYCAHEYTQSNGSALTVETDNTNVGTASPGSTPRRGGEATVPSLGRGEGHQPVPARRRGGGAAGGRAVRAATRWRFSPRCGVGRTCFAECGLSITAPFAYVPYICQLLRLPAAREFCTDLDGGITPRQVSGCLDTGGSAARRNGLCLIPNVDHASQLELVGMKPPQRGFGPLATSSTRLQRQPSVPGLIELDRSTQELRPMRITISDDMAGDIPAATQRSPP